MPGVSKVHGVVEEWDNSEVVCQTLRDHHRLILPAPFKAKVQIEVLKPLVRRLRDESGSVGMLYVPNLQREILG